MVIIWLMMVNNNLVGGFNPSEKYARQMGLIFATVSGKSVKIPWFQSPPTSYIKKWMKVGGTPMMPFLNLDPTVGRSKDAWDAPKTAKLRNDSALKFLHVGPPPCSFNERHGGWLGICSKYFKVYTNWV